MPLDEFWHGDIRLLGCYEKAYYRNLTLTAWKIGQHTFEAQSKTIYNGFGRKNVSDKCEMYDTWKDPFDNKKNPVAYINNLTPEELEKKYREDCIANNEWLFNLK